MTRKEGWKAERKQKEGKTEGRRDKREMEKSTNDKDK